MPRAANENTNEHGENKLATCGVLFGILIQPNKESFMFNCYI